MTLSDRLVNAMRELGIKCSILTVMSKLSDGQPEKLDDIEKLSDKELKEAIKKAFPKEGP